MSTFNTTRTFTASPDAVFAALASPSRLAKWWGPAGFRNTFEQFAFTPGGRWRFIMHGPDGAEYPNEAVFEVIEANARVVIQHTNQPHFRLTLRFEATAAGTLVTWEQQFADREFAAAVAHIVKPANEENLDRWQAEVAAGAEVARVVPG